MVIYRLNYCFYCVHVYHYRCYRKGSAHALSASAEERAQQSNRGRQLHVEIPPQLRAVRRLLQPRGTHRREGQYARQQHNHVRRHCAALKRAHVALQVSPQRVDDRQRGDDRAAEQEDREVVAQAAIGALGTAHTPQVQRWAAVPHVADRIAMLQPPLPTASE